MHETAVSNSQNASARCDTPGETLKKLELYLGMVAKAHEASRLLEKAGLLRDRVAPQIFQSVETDYRKRLEDAQERLEQEKRILGGEFQKLGEERERLQKNTARARERIQELVFRHVLGEPNADHSDKEREELTRQIKSDSSRLTELDQVCDLFAIMGFHRDAGPRDPEKEREDKSVSAESSGASTGPDEGGTAPQQPDQPSSPAATGLQAHAITPPAEETAPPPEEQPAPKPLPLGGSKDSAGSHYALCVLNGSLKGERFSLIRGNMSIGRAQDNDIRVDDPALGKSHAMIIYMEGKYHLKNLDALNRTYVNGIQVDSSLLKDGDIIVLGEIRLRVSSGEPLS